MRDRSQTETAILDAAGRLFLREGFSSLGINAVAREAGVSKVLIYRYFGSLEGLLEAWALKNTYWADRPQQPMPPGSIRESVLFIFRGLIESLRSDPLRREVLRWLLVDDSEIARRVRARLEERGAALTRGFAGQQGVLSGADAEATAALLIGGLSYLALMADRAGIYNGVPLDSDEGWSRLLKAVEILTGTILDS